MILQSGRKITELLKDTCLDIEMWCRRWKLAVNGSKTEILSLTNSHAGLTQIELNGENCKISETTNSLGFNIVFKINCKQHTEISVAEATGNWHILRKHSAPSEELLFRPKSIFTDLPYNPTFDMEHQYGLKRTSNPYNSSKTISLDQSSKTVY